MQKNRNCLVGVSFLLLLLSSCSADSDETEAQNLAEPVVASSADEEGKRSASVTLWTTNQLEEKTKALLQSLLDKHRLDKYRFTDEVVITFDTNPRSHPVITLHTRYHDDADRLLALYIHEQLHWHLAGNEDSVDDLKEELRTMFRSVPSGISNGGGYDEESTYLHLILCTLEFQALQRLLGDSRSQELFAEPQIYEWIYTTVLENEKILISLVAKHNLVIEKTGLE